MDSSVARPPEGLGPEGRQPAGTGLALPAGPVLAVAWLLAASLLGGCGQKGPLFLPQPLPQASQPTMGSPAPPQAAAVASAAAGPGQEGR